MCPICGSTNWKSEGKGWKRCNLCGYLETTIIERQCIKCGKTIGKYAKKNTTECFDCKDKKKYIRATVKNCATPYCLNHLKTKQGEKYCRQCRYEIAEWSVNNGNLWKLKAYRELQKPIHVSTLYERLKKKYPEIKEQKVNSFIIIHKKKENILRLSKGVYVWTTKQNDSNSSQTTEKEL